MKYPVKIKMAHLHLLHVNFATAVNPLSFSSRVPPTALISSPSSLYKVCIIETLVQNGPPDFLKSSAQPL